MNEEVLSKKLDADCFAKTGDHEITYDPTTYENSEFPEDPFATTPLHMFMDTTANAKTSHTSTGNETLMARIDTEEFDRCFRAQGLGGRAVLVGSSRFSRSLSACEEEEPNKYSSSAVEAAPENQAIPDEIIFTDNDFLASEYWTMVSGNGKDKWVEDMRKEGNKTALFVHVHDCTPYTTCGLAVFKEGEDPAQWVRYLNSLLFLNNVSSIRFVSYETNESFLNRRKARLKLWSRVFTGQNVRHANGKRIVRTHSTVRWHGA